MGSLGVHAAWLFVALLAALGWGRTVAADKEREFQQRLAKAPPAARTKGPQPPRPLEPAGETAPDVPPPAEESGTAKEEKPPAAPLGAPEIRTLLQSKNRRDVERGVRAIEKIADPSLRLALLREALAVEEDRGRERALDLLRKIGGPDAAELVAHALRTDPDGDVRRRAARHLGEMGGPSALAALQEVATAPDMDLQVTAVAALNKLGHAGPMHLTIQKLGAMVGDPDGALREDAVGWLDDLRSPAAIPQLSQALRDSNSDIRRDAIDALEELGIPDVVPLLEGMLRDPHPAVVRDAQRALERLREPREENP